VIRAEIRPGTTGDVPGRLEMLRWLWFWRWLGRPRPTREGTVDTIVCTVTRDGETLEVLEFLASKAPGPDMISANLCFKYGEMIMMDVSL
jgi:hypothetical protein